MASSSSSSETKSSSSKTEQKKMITLQSSDKDVFEIEQSILIQSGTIKNMVEDGFTFIPLPNVDTETLIKIIEYMKKHADKTDSKEEDIKEFDKDFVKKTLNELFALVFAANYLHISSLLELLYPSIADRIKDKTTEAIRQIFSIPCDFTPEEVRRIIKDNKWAREGTEIEGTLD